LCVFPSTVSALQQLKQLRAFLAHLLKWLCPLPP
jgi:hypothetical protein